MGTYKPQDNQQAGHIEMLLTTQKS